MVVSHKTFGPLIRQWHETRSMPRRAKLYALFAIFAGGAVSILSVETSAMRLFIAAALVIPVSIILKIKTSQ